MISTKPFKIRNMTMKNFYSILFIVFLCSLTMLVQAQEATSPKIAMPLTTAHRGLSGLAPENTLTAFKWAVAIGANSTECDVYRTADGVLVLSHDRNTKRTTGIDADITKMTFEEVRKFDAGSWKGKQFAGEQIPTLEEYLKVLKDTKCIPIIEIKQPGTEKDIVELLGKLNMTEDVFIVSFNSESLAEVKRLEPLVKFVHIFSWKLEGSAESNAEDIAVKLAEDIAVKLMDKAAKVGTNIVSLNHGMLSKKLVDLLHEKEFYVWAWTVNDIPRMNTLLDWNVDNIATDRADILVELIKQRKK
jgi:glycerophosphoryl diester phosphodiesterase